MTYFHNVIDGNVYSTSDLKGEKTTLIKYKVITPITDAQGKNYLIMVNPTEKSYKVIKKEVKGNDYYTLISVYEDLGFKVVKDFDKKETIKL